MPVRDDDATIAACKQMLADALPLAVSTLKELMTLGEKESVRLAAAESIMERGGLPKKTELSVTVDQSEHDRATQEAEDMLQAMSRNKQALNTPKPSLEAVMIHEGDDDELPIAAPDTYDNVIDAEVIDDLSV